MDKDTASDLVNKLKETLHPTGEPHFSENQPQSAQAQSTQPKGVQPQTRRRNSDSGGIGQKVKSLVEGSSLPDKHKSREQQQHPSTRQSGAQRERLDPRDAAHVPPSVFAKHVGEPSIEHAYPEDSSTRRHSSATHQEAHYNMG